MRYLFYAAHVDLFSRAVQWQKVRDAYKQASALCQNERERAFLQLRLTGITERL